MPYKDKDKSSEAVKRYRERKGLHQGITETGGITRDNILIQHGTRVIEVDTNKAAKLLMICNALDKTTTALDGKRSNLLDHVRYGAFGPTLASVKRALCLTL